MQLILTVEKGARLILSPPFRIHNSFKVSVSNVERRWQRQRSRRLVRRRHYYTHGLRFYCHWLQLVYGWRWKILQDAATVSQRDQLYSSGMGQFYDSWRRVLLRMHRHDPGVHQIRHICATHLIYPSNLYRRISSFHPSAYTYILHYIIQRYLY